MEEGNAIPDKILQRAKRIYELSKAKDIIKWYDNQKILWFERKIEKAKEKRNKRIEKEIKNRAAVGWNKLIKYEESLKTKYDKLIFIKTKDGRTVLVDENDPRFNTKD